MILFTFAPHKKLAFLYGTCSFVIKYQKRRAINTQKRQARDSWQEKERAQTHRRSKALEAWVVARVSLILWFWETNNAIYFVYPKILYEKIWGHSCNCNPCRLLCDFPIQSMKVTKKYIWLYLLFSYYYSYIYFLVHPTPV